MTSMPLYDDQGLCTWEIHYYFLEGVVLLIAWNFKYLGEALHHQAICVGFALSSFDILLQYWRIGLFLVFLVVCYLGWGTFLLLSLC